MHCYGNHTLHKRWNPQVSPETHCNLYANMRSIQLEMTYFIRTVLRKRCVSTLKKKTFFYLWFKDSRIYLVFFLREDNHTTVSSALGEAECQKFLLTKSHPVFWARVSVKLVLECRKIYFLALTVWITMNSNSSPKLEFYIIQTATEFLPSAYINFQSPLLVTIDYCIVASFASGNTYLLTGFLNKGV